MSSASSVVTYTSVYTDSEPGRVFWGADDELSDGGYVAESDPEEDPEDNSSGYDADDEDEDDEDEKEEEEHLAPADSIVVIPIDEFTSISLPPEAEVERLLAMPTLPPSPLTSLSPPSTGERLARCTTPAALPSPPLPPFLYPPPIDRREGESSTRGRGVDYGFSDTFEAEMRHRGIREVGYGIRDTWIDPVEAVHEMASTTLEKDDSLGDIMDHGGGGLCCPRGLGSIDRVKPDKPIYLEYIPLEDEHILLAEKQPLLPIVSPTTESPGYVAESDPEEDPEDNSSGYDADDEDEDDEDEKEEEEHLAPADSIVVIPIDEFTSISLPPEAEVERLLAMPTLPPSPLTSLSPPSTGERLARCTTPAALPSPPLPPFLYPPPIDRREGESSTRGRGVDYGFSDTFEAEMRHRGIREVGYGIRDTWIDPVEAVHEMASTTLEKVNTRVTELAGLYEHDT
nr:hypothetical protein [Tanacetum cinerariifolium]